MAAQRSQSSSGGGGCAGVVGLLLVVGLAIEYWYVALGLIAIGTASVAIAKARRRRQLRHRPGPWDAWINEVNVALADLGLVEHARNQRVPAGGIPVEADIVLRTWKVDLTISLFATPQSAHQAEMGLRASPNVRTELQRGRRAIVTRDRVMFDAVGRQGGVDEFLLDEVVRVVDRLPVQRSARVSAAITTTSVSASHNSLDELHQLAALHNRGVLTDDEFAERKASLLKRL
jgi:hypothetical protein